MQRIAVVDYGMGNLDSVRRAFEECGAAPSIAVDPDDLRKADKIVLPGVGAFPEAMARLRSSGMADAMRTEVDAGAPFLGVCLGMQLLMTEGTEGGPTDGLGWIDGTVERLVPVDAAERVPHVGWNELHRAGGRARLLDGLPDGADVYFVHSYRVVCADPADVAATTPYCGGFTSVMERDNVHAAQFHPEKSQRHGFELLRNFLAV
jgi:imidazole glycerol-phosphate synthase subunit HisH